MSYSFSVCEATRPEVLVKVSAEFDKVVSGQPIHAADRAQAEKTVESFLGIIPGPNEAQNFSVSVSGWVSWDVSQTVTSANVNVSVSLVPKEPS
jgi:hypothetical protein